MKNSVRIEPYNNIKYYCFDKKIFYPNEIWEWPNLNMGLKN